MARRPPSERRLHVDGGMYYIFQPALSDQPICIEDNDGNIFIELLQAYLPRRRVRLHGYAFGKEGFHFALEVKDEPASVFIDVLKTHYSGRFNKAHGISGNVMGAKYESLLIEKEAYFLKLIRYIHSRPNIRSSHRAYLGEECSPWLVTAVARAMLAAKKEKARRLYREFMAQEVPTEEAELFENRSPRDSRVLGGATFRSRLQDVLPYQSPQTLDDVIRSVELEHGVSRDEMISRTYNKEAQLARYVVLWNATQRGIATLSEVASRFERASSTMSEGLPGQRELYPGLFPIIAPDNERPKTAYRPEESPKMDRATRTVDELLLSPKETSLFG